MSKQKVSVSMELAYSEALSYMKDLVKGMESGRINVESGEESVTLVPSERIAIKVEAKVKKDKQKFAFELSWADQAEPTLVISDSKPETAGEAPVEEKKIEDRKEDDKKEKKDKKEKAEKQSKGEKEPKEKKDKKETKGQKK